MLPLLVFDYDGVIHNNLCVYEPAFRKVHEEMIRDGIIAPETVSSERLSGWFGMTARDMWEDFHPELPLEVRDEAAARIGVYLVENVRNHKARWYDGAAEALDALKEKGFQMVILSNSRAVTGEAHFAEFGLAKWFLKWYDSESAGWLAKAEIIKGIRKEHPEGLIMIGDRAADFDAAKAVNAPFIGCAYGFAGPGELDDAPYLASAVSELPGIIERIIFQTGLSHQ